MLGPPSAAVTSQGRRRATTTPPRMALLGSSAVRCRFDFVLILIGVYKNGEGPSGLPTLPEAAWELSLGIYCAVNGFRSSSPSPGKRWRRRWRSEAGPIPVHRASDRRTD